MADAEGYSVAEAADLLNCTPQTVRNYLRNYLNGAESGPYLEGGRGWRGKARAFWIARQSLDALKRDGSVESVSRPSKHIEVANGSIGDLRFANLALLSSLDAYRKALDSAVSAMKSRRKADRKYEQSIHSLNQANRQLADALSQAQIPDDPREVDSGA